MARVIPSATRRWLEMQESGEALLMFLTISHASLATPIRVVSDGVDYTWQSVNWTGFPFRVGLLTDDETAPRCQIEVQNVDRQIGDALKGLTSPAALRLDLLAASEFDETATPRTPRGTPPLLWSANHLRLVNVSVGALTVTGDVVSWDYTQDTWPARRATQDRFPGLFR